MPTPKVSLTADNLLEAGCLRKKLFRPQERVTRPLYCSTTRSAEQFDPISMYGLLSARATIRRQLGSLPREGRIVASPNRIQRSARQREDQKTVGKKTTAKMRFLSL